MSDECARGVTDISIQRSERLQLREALISRLNSLLKGLFSSRGFN